jgi:uncharacterized protein
MSIEIILVTSFLYGLTSSLHCIGMCGPFVATLNIGGDNRFLTNLLYNLGRAWSYFLLGFFLGYLGEKVNFAGSYLQIQRVAAMISAIFIIAIGVGMIFNKALFSYNSGFSTKIIQPIMEAIRKTKSHALLALTIGLVSGLLPCGILYPAYSMSFAGGNSIVGGLSMLSFFVGTFPGLFIFGMGFHAIKKYVQPSLVSFLGIVVVLVGISTIILRFNHNH